MARRKIPWDEIRREYVEGAMQDGIRIYPSQRDLAERYEIDPGNIGRKAKAEQWAVQREILVSRCTAERQQKTIEVLSDKGSEFDLTAFRAADMGVSRVEKALDKPMMPEDLAKLATALRTFHQVGRLALGESTDNAEVNVSGARKRLIAIVDRVASRCATTNTEPAE